MRRRQYQAPLLGVELPDGLLPGLHHDVQPLPVGRELVDEPGAGDVWVAHTPTYTDWFDFIDPAGNYDPFGIGSGYMDIRCQQNGSSSNGFDGYTSGLLSSVDQNGNGFAQEYGYFECSMCTPGGTNTWPAFWLLDQPHVANPSANLYQTAIPGLTANANYTVKLYFMES